VFRKSERVIGYNFIISLFNSQYYLCQVLRVRQGCKDNLAGSTLVRYLKMRSGLSYLYDGTND
jgi:hypothetical protein